MGAKSKWLAVSCHHPIESVLSFYGSVIVWNLVILFRFAFYGVDFSTVFYYTGCGNDCGGGGGSVVDNSTVRL